jgi:predicted nuclease of restriction endonuclease-like RecB superfamily
MAFRTEDLRVSVRRDRGREHRRLYPRLIRDDTLKPRIGIALRYFETKLGLARRDLDAEALIQLFGEPKLARCIVSCLARSYRYRTRSFTELLGTERASALAERGVVGPRELRALAYARANETGGFVGPAERARFLDSLLPELDLVEAEQALWLDAPDQAILTRVGPVPEVEEVLALYNLRTLESLFRVARRARLALRGDRALVSAVCARHGVRATFASDGPAVTLHGQQDTLGSWTRHGARVARAALTLLACRALGPGEAEVTLRDEAFDVILDANLLADALPARGWSAPPATWSKLEPFVKGLLAERRAGRLVGWRLTRWPAPLVSAQGAIWPEFAISRGSIAIGLLPLPAAAVRAEASALAALAARVPVIVLAQGTLREASQGLTVLRLTGPNAATDLTEYLAQTFPAAADDVLPAWLAAVADATRAAGSLAESELAGRLECAEDEIATRIAPLAVGADDLTYIEGFGLCSHAFLDRANTLLAAEVDRAGGRLDLGVLGRQMRVLAGRNEGLQALIAHLSGAVRLAA